MLVIFKALLSLERASSKIIFKRNMLNGSPVSDNGTYTVEKVHTLYVHTYVQVSLTQWFSLFLE